MHAFDTIAEQGRLDANKEELNTRLQYLIYVSSESGLDLDTLEVLSRGLDSKALARFCGNALILPKYKKSNVVS